MLVALGDAIFKKINCSEVTDLTHPENYQLCLHVYYTEGGLTEYADTMALQMKTGNATLFEGSLLKEPSPVTLSIKDASDPDDIEVNFTYAVLNFILINNVISAIYRCPALNIRLRS